MSETEIIFKPMTRRRIRLRRLVLFLCVTLSTIVATTKWITYLPSDAAKGVQAALVLLFALTFGWIALFFFSSVAGFFTLLKNRRMPGLVRVPFETKLHSRNVILMPVYNEDPHAVFARLTAMAEDLVQTGQEKHFDFFVISDTTKPDIWLLEEERFLALKDHFQKLGIRLFYRRRPRNVARKSGNIEDFCVRFGAGYDFMVVLDADSLMRGDTLVKMAQLMEVNPTTGIIQAPPALINGQSRFARLQQFAGHVYGPVITAGLAWWQVWDSNYWGHNAIIRIKAFQDSCALPVLSGKAPFGGMILSHDFVEAALIRRAGWLAWMLPELGGSYEECPPSLIDFAARDRRWCQGNLQHIRILFSKNLHPVSRIHFLCGIMSYVSSPLWFLFLVLGLGIAFWRVFFPPVYFAPVKTLFPTWPVFDWMGTLILFIVSMAFLITPKILGGIYISINRRRVKRFGGHIALWSGFLAETVVSILTAPIMMLFQTRFVFEILSGFDSGWNTQNRGAEGTSWRQAFRHHAGHTVVGLLTIVAVWLYIPRLFWWVLPVAAGLVLSVPISVWLSRTAMSGQHQKPRLFGIPTETRPPLLLMRANALLKKAPPHFDDVFNQFLKDPVWLNAHIVLLRANGPAPAVDATVRESLARKSAAFIHHGQPLSLTDAEKIACLYRPDLLRQLALASLPV